MDFEKVLEKEEVYAVEIDSHISVADALASYIGLIDGVVERASTLVVGDSDSSESAISLTCDARGLLDKIEGVRKELNAPHNEFIRHVNSQAKKLTEKVDMAITILTSKINGWRAIQTQKIEEAKEANPELYVADIVPTLSSEKGSATVRKNWLFDVEDLSLVPAEYLMLDERKVKLHIKAGTRKIPGIKIYQEDQTIIKRKGR